MDSGRPLDIERASASRTARVRRGVAERHGCGSAGGGRADERPDFSIIPGLAGLLDRSGLVAVDAGERQRRVSREVEVGGAPLELGDVAHAEPDAAAGPAAGGDDVTRPVVEAVERGHAALVAD